MDKKLILAVAGSGKTTHILNDLKPENRSVILTYTNQNLFSIEESLRRNNGGIVPAHVEVRTYFSFLYSFCLRPYLSYDLRDNGLVYGPVPISAQKKKKSSLEHYMSSGRYLYAARAAKLLLESKVMPKVKERLRRHFDCLYVDEVQDFAANDFNFLLDISQSGVKALYAGDYYQHTYDTSRDGSTRSTLHSKGLEAYIAEFKKVGFIVDDATLASSRRCSPSVCAYISDTLGIEIDSHRTDAVEVRYLSDPTEIVRVFLDPKIVKLFYQSYQKHNCVGNNWGNSKGLDSYTDVCVVLNKTTFDLLQKGKGRDLATATKNKLYVACSRARGNLYFVEEAVLKRLALLE